MVGVAEENAFEKHAKENCLHDPCMHFKGSCLPICVKLEQKILWNVEHYSLVCPKVRWVDSF